MKKLFIKPENILHELDIKEGMHIADFGCGAGAWTIPAAFLVGEGGKVYAIDILEHMLEVTGSKAKKFNLKNVELIKTDIEIPDKIKIKKESCDLVIISNILFQLKEKEKAFMSVKKVLKKGGNALVIDWQSEDMLGPDKNQQLKIEDVKKIAEQAGFKFKKQVDAGHFHYGLLFNLNS